MGQINKYYIIVNNKIENVALYREEDAVKLNLKMYPIYKDGKLVDINWTYLPNEDTFLPPPRDILQEWREIENYQQVLINEINQYVSPLLWDTYSSEEKDLWREYLHKIRNIRDGILDPKEIIWPQKPLVEVIYNYKPSEPEV